MLKLSVVTINFNNHNGLKKTMESVVSQTNSNFEYIIIDGNSTDGSVDIINQFKTKINYFVTEKDNGIYDALNKGIKAAKGEYLLFLNSGDSFYSNDVVEHFLLFIEKNNATIIYGNSNILLDGDTSELLQAPEHLDLNFWYTSTLNHQAVFAKKKLFDEYGLFDLNYKICSDFDFLLKVFYAKPNEFKHFEQIVCHYDQSGFSASPENFNNMLEERKAIIHKYFSETELKVAVAAYDSTLSFKRKMLNNISDKPILNAAFKRVLSVYSRLKGNGS